MKTFIITTVIASIVFGCFYIFSTRDFEKLFAKENTDRFQLCLDQAREEGASISVCSEISSAASSAYWSAVSTFNPIINVLLTLVCLLLGAVSSASKQLKEIRKKLNE